MTPRRDRPLTYEMSNPPHYIAHRKAWNSWNTGENFLLFYLTSFGGSEPTTLTQNTFLANVRGDGKIPYNFREAQTITEDMFIRKFMTGTFHGMVCSEVIIKRQFNTIRVGSIMSRGLTPRKFYFLIGYAEEMLSNWLQCPTTLEIQTIADKKEVIFKYI